MKHIKKIAITSFIAFLMICVSFLYLESQIAYAIAPVTDSVIVTLNVDAGISITSPADTTMSTSLGVSTNVAVGTTTWNVKTNNNAGYTLAFNASTLPAMKSGALGILDYQTGAPNTWSVAVGNGQFGYSATGTDVSTGTWGTGNFCNGASTSTVNTTLNYKGFTTSPFTVATRAATTTTLGVNTSLCYAVEQNTFYIASGVYTATITATATAL